VKAACDELPEKISVTTVG